MSTKSRKRLSALKRAKTKLHRWGEDHIGCSFTSPLPTSSSTQPSSRKSFWWAGVPGGNTSSGSSPQRCRSSAWLACLVVTAFSSGAGTALTSSSCQGLQSPESRVQKDVEGEASKGAGRSLLKPGARELSLKRDNRNTRRVHHSIKGINTFLEFSGNRSSQGLRKDVDVEGAATKGAGSSSPEPGDAATLSLKRQNENATRELSYGIKGKGKHTSLDGPSDVDVDVEDGSGLVEEMVRLLQYSLEVVAVVLLGCWLQDTIFLTLSPLGSSASAKRRLPQEKLHPQEHSRPPSYWSQKQHRCRPLWRRSSTSPPGPSWSSWRLQSLSSRDSSSKRVRHAAPPAPSSCWWCCPSLQQHGFPMSCFFQGVWVTELCLEREGAVLRGYLPKIMFVFLTIG